MSSLQPSAAAGRVNGLERPQRISGRKARLPRAHPTSFITAGAGLYATAMIFPIVLRQVDVIVFALAVLGTALFLVGLHIRWTKTPERAPHAGRVA